MKSTAIHIFIYLLLIYVAGQCLKLYLDEHSRANRIEANFKASKQEAEYYKTRSGEMAVKVTAMEMTVKEIRSTFPSVIQDLKSMYIRPAAIQSYSKFDTELKKDVKAIVKDSIVYLPDSSKYTARSLRYRDKWFSVSGTIYQDTAALAITATDTISAVIFSERKHPFWWILSKRQTKAVIKNCNPSVKIHIQQEIIIKK